MSQTCEGCHGFGGNWDCLGENDPDDCNCESCTGSEDCPECGGLDEDHPGDPADDELADDREIVTLQPDPIYL